MKIFYDGELASCCGGKHKGQEVQTVRWLHDHWYLCQLCETRIELVLHRDEILKTTNSKTDHKKVS